MGRETELKQAHLWDQYDAALEESVDLDTQLCFFRVRLGSRVEQDGLYPDLVHRQSVVEKIKSNLLAKMPEYIKDLG
jgi:hypothetical protein